MPDDIRVGLIRCDGHAIWYGALMAEIDPLLLQRPALFRPGKTSHSWQGGGVHRFFYDNYGDPTLRTAPYIGGFRIAKLWDEEPEVAEQARRVFRGVPEVCDSFAACSDDVDLVFIADCNLDGHDHLELARPGLEKGVPTFVDKPLAATSGDCRAMVDLARATGTPLFSASILRFEPVVARFRDRFPEVGAVNFAAITGAGASQAGLVHTVSTAQHLFGPGICTVHAMAAPKQTAVLLGYDDNPAAPSHGVMIHTEGGRRRFPSALSADVFGTRDDIHILVPGGYAYPHGAAEIVKKVRDMVRTGTSPVELDDMIEAVAVMDAARASMASGRAERVIDFPGTS